MPTYEYECPDCGHRFEQMQKITEDPVSLCPECGGDSVRRLVSAAAFHLKGSGWYKTDYAANGSKDSNASSEKSDSSSPSDSSDSGSTAASNSSDSKKESSKDAKSSDSSTSSPSSNSD